MGKRVLQNPLLQKRGRKLRKKVLVSRLYGKPVPLEEARERWPERYDNKKTEKKNGRSGSSKKDDSDEEVLLARCHYTQAEVDGCIFNLNDYACVKGEPGKPNYIGKIVELFETTDGEPYFTAQWFFKAEDTVIGDGQSA